MTPIKIKDAEDKEIIFLHNYKETNFIHAYQKTVFITNENKWLVCRVKNCAQRLLDPEETVYRPFKNAFIIST